MPTWSGPAADADQVCSAETETTPLTTPVARVGTWQEALEVRGRGRGPAEHTEAAGASRGGVTDDLDELRCEVRTAVGTVAQLRTPMPGEALLRWRIRLGIGRILS
jgi:hypothetical protein